MLIKIRPRGSFGIAFAQGERSETCRLAYPMDPFDRKLETTYRVVINLTTVTLLLMAALLSVQFYRVYSVSKAEARRNKHYVSSTLHHNRSVKKGRYDPWFRKPEMRALPLKSPDSDFKESLRGQKSKAKKTFEEISDPKNDL